MVDRSPLQMTKDVLDKYIELRQSGLNASDSLRKVQDIAETIDFDSRIQLGAQIKSWEAAEAAKRRLAAAPPPAPVTRAPVAPEPIQAEPSNPIPTYIAPSPSTNMMGMMPPIELQKAPAVEQIICPNCGKQNGVNSSYCYSCGHLLKANRLRTRTFTTAELEGTDIDNAHFGQFTKVYLHLANVPQPLEVQVEGDMIIGRNTAESAVKPDVDLDPYQGAELGVSRLHATLRRQNDTILIMDMTSANHTYLNGRRLHPQEVHVLRDGDELRLGRLTMQVRFKQRLRRL